jgi:hypothetical protein
VTFNVGSISPNHAQTYFLVGPPTICPLWVDLDPAAGGLVRFQSDGYASFGVCFQNVPNKGTGNSNTFSMTARSGVSVEFSFLSVASPAGLVGLGPGAAQGVPLLLDYTSRPFVFPAGRVPFEDFISNFDLAGQTLTFPLDSAGRPTGVY